MKILLDNGHGVDTPGKRSPDGLLREYAFARALAARIAEQLMAQPGIDCGLLVPEVEDVPLAERCRRCNAAAPSLLLSLHVNAAGNGASWLNARGWSVYVGPRANSASRRAASALAASAEEVGLTVRRPAPGIDYWTQNLAICRDTICPSVLTENLFMDNRDDCAFLLSPSAIDTLANLHTRAILCFAA